MRKLCPFQISSMLPLDHLLEAILLVPDFAASLLDADHVHTVTAFEFPVGNLQACPVADVQIECLRRILGFRCWTSLRLWRFCLGLGLVFRLLLSLRHPGLLRDGDQLLGEWLQRRQHVRLEVGRGVPPAQRLRFDDWVGLGPDLLQELVQLRGDVDHGHVLVGHTPVAFAVLALALPGPVLRHRQERFLQLGPELIHLPQDVCCDRLGRKHDLALHDPDGGDLAGLGVEAPLEVPLPRVHRGQQERQVVHAQHRGARHEGRGAALQALHRGTHAEVLPRRLGPVGAHVAGHADGVAPVGHGLDLPGLPAALAAVLQLARVLQDLPVQHEGLDGPYELQIVLAISVFIPGLHRGLNVEFPPAGTELMEPVDHRDGINENRDWVVFSPSARGRRSLPFILLALLPHKVEEDQLVFLGNVDLLGPLAADCLAQPLVVLLCLPNVPLHLQLVRGLHHHNRSCPVEALLLHDTVHVLLLVLLAPGLPPGLQAHHYLVAEADGQQGTHGLHVLAEDLRVLRVPGERGRSKLLTRVDFEPHGGQQALDGDVGGAPWFHHLAKPGGNVRGLRRHSLHLLWNNVPVPRETSHGPGPVRGARVDPLHEQLAQHQRLRVAPAVAPEAGLEGPLQLPAVLPLVLQHHEAGGAEGVGGREPGHHGDGVAGRPHHQAKVQQAAQAQVARQRHRDVAERGDLGVLRRLVQGAHVGELRDGRLYQLRRRGLHNTPEQQRGRRQVHVDLRGDDASAVHAGQLRAQLLRLQVQLGQRGAQHLWWVEQHHGLEKVPRHHPHGGAWHGPPRTTGSLLAGGLGTPGRHQARHEAPRVVLDGAPEAHVYDRTDGRQGQGALGYVRGQDYVAHSLRGGVEHLLLLLPRDQRVHGEDPQRNGLLLRGHLRGPVWQRVPALLPDEAASAVPATGSGAVERGQSLVEGGDVRDAGQEDDERALLPRHLLHQLLAEHVAAFDDRRLRAFEPRRTPGDCAAVVALLALALALVLASFASFAAALVHGSDGALQCSPGLPALDPVVGVQVVQVDLLHGEGAHANEQGLHLGYRPVELLAHVGELDLFEVLGKEVRLEGCAHDDELDVRIALHQQLQQHREEVSIDAPLVYLV
mmetsp:Transcript_25564/g.68194  ORF Transcript_25564/g.68194 Transcript_25564/m.68194 type:complete len:1104 (+) Transcript_25564:97-3408(+)